MWGYKLYQNRDVANKIFNLIVDKGDSVNFKKSDGKGHDQYFLRDRVYPLIKFDSVIHDSYLCNYYRKSEPFPTKRKGDCFIGRPGPCNETATGFYECPVVCRPKLHQDWINC